MCCIDSPGTRADHGPPVAEESETPVHENYKHEPREIEQYVLSWELNWRSEFLWRR